MARRGKRAAILAGVLCLAVLAVAAYASRNVLLEAWYFHVLDTGDEEDRRQPMFKKQDLFKKGDDSLVDRIGYRLRSRIYEMCKVVPMEGEDYRQLVKQAGYRF